MPELEAMTQIGQAGQMALTLRLPSTKNHRSEVRRTFQHSQKAQNACTNTTQAKTTHVLFFYSTQYEIKLTRTG